ncbi:hypothetical protein PRIPAC_74990 [Pristionchus pacificus]|uniref:Uncharacterized protein n=1 Tax=Pristionchus pacificus TaxID=54126 RepID=A0A2A6B4L4_PRIPA|nr:hypothetical protein PRIPAC_74990 [Pristionchus pacificus]|eukprot:PDM60812.1 hypothetical protein PRIPAC_54618 [Pristionchus pacificus]
MRVPRPAGTVIRSHEDAIEDVKNLFGAMRRYGMADIHRQPADAQPFSVSSSQGDTYLHGLSKQLGVDRRYPRPLLFQKENFLQKLVKSVIDPRWVVKDLSSLSPLLLDDAILPDIASKSHLSSLTNRQLSCLDVTDDDFVGIDGIVDRWRRIDLAPDDPSGLLSSIKIGMSAKQEKPILSYTVDMMAIYRKNILTSKMGSLPPPTAENRRLMPAPKAYGLPYIRMMYATVEFAHLGTEKIGTFSEEPFLLNFHVHSF